MHQNYLSWGKVTQDVKRGGLGGLKVIKSVDILLTDGHIFMQQTPPPKQGGDCVAWQINFPLPHTHLVSHEALIQPLLSPLASADWLTYGIALFCFSSSLRSPENQTLLPVNLFWFFFLEKESFVYFLYVSDSAGRTPWIQEMSLRDLIYRLFFYVSGDKQVWRRLTSHRTAGGLAQDLLGSYTSRVRCWHFQQVFRKCTKGVSFYIG